MKDLTERKHFTGIVKLSGGKAEPFLSLPKAAAEKGYTVPNYQPFTAVGTVWSFLRARVMAPRW